MGDLRYKPCTGLTRASMVLPLREVHAPPDPGNDELSAQSYDTAAAKDYGILIGGIDVDFRI
jgi:hypothetical protein